LLLSTSSVFSEKKLPVHQKDTLSWTAQNMLPTPKGEVRQFGLAGALIGLSNHHLIIAGGANFPDGLPWKGGERKFWRTVYVANLLQTNEIEWTSEQTLLPHPLAYTANVNFQNGFISIGGENSKGPVATVSYWQWEERTATLLEEKFPDLPKPTSNASASIL